MSLNVRAVLESILNQKIALSTDAHHKTSVGKVSCDVLEGLTKDYEVAGPYLIGSRVTTAVLAQFEKSKAFDCLIKYRDIDVKVVVIAKGEGSVFEEQVVRINAVITDILNSYFSEYDTKSFLKILPPVYLGPHVTQYMYELGPDSCPLQLSLYIHKNVQRPHPIGVFSAESLFFDLSEKVPRLRLDVSHQCFVSSPSEIKGKYNTYVRGCLEEFERNIEDLVDVEGVAPEWIASLKEDIAHYRNTTLLPYEKNKESDPRMLFERLIILRKRVKELLEIVHLPLAVSELRAGVLHCPRPYEIFSGMWRYLEKLIIGFRSPLKGLIDVFWRGQDFHGLTKEFNNYFLKKKKYEGLDLIAVYLQLLMTETAQPTLKALKAYALQELKKLLSVEIPGLASFITDFENIEPLIWPLILQAEDFVVVYHADQLCMRLKITIREEKSFFLLIPFSFIPKHLPFPSEDQLLFLMTLPRTSYLHQDALLLGEKKRIQDLLKSAVCPFYLYLWSKRQNIPLEAGIKLQVLGSIIKYRKYFEKAPDQALEDVLANLGFLDSSTTFTLLQCLQHVPQELIAKHTAEIMNLVQVVLAEPHETIPYSEGKELLMFFAASFWKIWSAKKKFKEALLFYKKLADSRWHIAYAPAFQSSFLREKDKDFVKKIAEQIAVHREIFDGTLAPLYLEWAVDARFYIQIMADLDALESFWLPSLEKALEHSLLYVKEEALFMKLWELGYRYLSLNSFLNALKYAMPLEDRYEKILEMLKNYSLPFAFWQGLLPLLSAKSFKKTYEMFASDKTLQNDHELWKIIFPYALVHADEEILSSFILLKKGLPLEAIPPFATFLMKHPLCQKYHVLLWPVLGELLATWYFKSDSFKPLGKFFLDQFWTLFLEELTVLRGDSTEQIGMNPALLIVMKPFFGHFSLDYFEISSFCHILRIFYESKIEIKLRERWHLFFKYDRAFLQKHETMFPIILDVFTPDPVDRLTCMVSIFNQRSSHTHFKEHLFLYTALNPEKKIMQFNGSLDEDINEESEIGMLYGGHALTYFAEESAKEEEYVRKNIPHLSPLLHQAVIAGNRHQAKEAFKSLVSLLERNPFKESTAYKNTFLSIAHCYLIFLRRGNVQDITTIREMFGVNIYTIDVMLAVEIGVPYFLLFAPYAENLLKEEKNPKGCIAFIEGILASISKSSPSLDTFKDFILKPFEWPNEHFPYHMLSPYVVTLASYIARAPYLIGKIGQWGLDFGKETQKTKNERQVKAFLEASGFIMGFMLVNLKFFTIKDISTFISVFQANLLSSGIIDPESLNRYEELYHRSLYLTKGTSLESAILEEQATVFLEAPLSPLKIHLSASLIQYVMQTYKGPSLKLALQKKFIEQIVEASPHILPVSYKVIHRKLISYLLWNIETHILKRHTDEVDVGYWQGFFELMPVLLREDLCDEKAVVAMITISSFALSKETELRTDIAKRFAQITDKLNIKDINPVLNGNICVRKGLAVIHYYEIMDVFKEKIALSGELTPSQIGRLKIIDSIVEKYIKDMLAFLCIPHTVFAEGVFFLQAKLFSNFIK